MWRLFTLLAILPVETSSLAGENAVLERPQVECSEETISFSIRTAHPFRGTIYIKGQHDSEVCRSSYFTNDQSAATFTIRIGDCGMLRMRQPRGVSYMAVFVATFHPQIVTKLDRAYNVRCTYEHADKVVDTILEIGALPTESIDQMTTILPNCQYSIREGSVEGPVARATNIGNKLFHRWECTNPRFGMLVRNCFVTDGDRESIKVVDDRGCPMRGERSPPTGQMVYDSALSLAYVEIEGFTFADRMRQQFRCEIKVCSKRDDECIGLTPPNCPLIPRSEFRPNSIIDTEVNPTQVLATFQGALRSNSLGNTIIDGTLTPAVVPQPPVVIPTMGSPDDYGHQPWRREQNSIHEDNDVHETETNSTKIEESSDEYHWDIPTVGPSERYQRDQPLNIFITSTTPASAVKHSGDQRHRRLADDVIDVESEFLYVMPFEDAPIPQPLPVQSDDTAFVEPKVTCLNRPALIILVVAFASTSLMTVLFISFVCTDLLKRNKETDRLEHVSVRSSASCLAEDPQAPIIFTRRLGQPNYVLPIGHHR